MYFKNFVAFLSIIVVTAAVVESLTAQTITANRTGKQGDYVYEYWTDRAVGTMILGDGGNFSCTWDTCQSILFKKGRRPGSKSEIITYSAVFNPGGNSYLAAYGWTKDPLIEYYIVESWGAWKPPGVTSKGTVVSDGGVYDIYEKYPSNNLIVAEKYKQFWSVRQTKRISGTITCANHFDAWAAKNMTMGELYEVMFLVEGYQSRGNADVTMSMTSGSTAIVRNLHISQSETVDFSRPGTLSKMEITGSRQPPAFNSSQNWYVSPGVYNLIGQEIFRLTEKENSTYKNHVFNNHYSTGKIVYRVTTGK
jgi:hypothetical protein